MFGSFLSAPRQSVSRLATSRAVRSAIESMETRTLLSVAIHGTAGDDNIAVSVGAGNALVVNLNGATTTYTPAQYAGGISIGTGGAHNADTLTIAGLPAVQTGVISGGLLRATVGTDAGGLQDIAATSLKLGGATGTLQLTVNDSSDTAARHLTLGAVNNSGVAFDVLHGLTPGDISAAASLLVVNLGNAGNTVDVTGTAPISKPVPVFAVVNLNTGNADDTVNVSATGAGTILNINGQNGHDEVNITDPMAGVQNIHGVVNVSNPLGHTTLRADDSADTGSRSMTLDTFTAAGVTYGAIQGLAPGAIDFAGANMDTVYIGGSVRGANSIVVNNTPGGGTIYASGLASARVLGTAAGQTLDLVRQFELIELTTMTVDFSTGRIGAHSNIVADTEVLNVIGKSAADQFTGSFLHVADGAAVSDVEDDIDAVNFSQGTLITDQIDVRPVNLSLGPAASVTFFGAPFENVGSLAISSGSSLTLGPHTASNPFPASLIVYGPMSIQGKLDVTNNELDLRDATPGQVRDLVRQGLGGRSGITSSAADASHNLGYAPGANGGVEVRWTLYGDANLDGKVDFNDLLALAQSYGRDDAFWYQGDFNYDGKVSFADLLKLGQNYGKSLG